MPLSERLNFSDKEMKNSIKINKWSGVNGYNQIARYCADNDIDLKQYTEHDIEGASLILEDFGQADKTTDCFYFSIDI